MLNFAAVMASDVGDPFIARLCTLQLHSPLLLHCCARPVPGAIPPPCIARSLVLTVVHGLHSGSVINPSSENLVARLHCGGFVMGRLLAGI